MPARCRSRRQRFATPGRETAHRLRTTEPQEQAPAIPAGWTISPPTGLPPCFFLAANDHTAFNRLKILGVERWSRTAAHPKSQRCAPRGAGDEPTIWTGTLSLKLDRQASESGRVLIRWWRAKGGFDKALIRFRAKKPELGTPRSLKWFRIN